MHVHLGRIFIDYSLLDLFCDVTSCVVDSPFSFSILGGSNSQYESWITHPGHSLRLVTGMSLYCHRLVLASWVKYVQSIAFIDTSQQFTVKIPFHTPRSLDFISVLNRRLLFIDVPDLDGSAKRGWSKSIDRRWMPLTKQNLLGMTLQISIVFFGRSRKWIILEVLDFYCKILGSRCQNIFIERREAHVVNRRFVVLEQIRFWAISESVRF